jgi:hypothetical protein
MSGSFGIRLDGSWTTFDRLVGHRRRSGKSDRGGGGGHAG